MINNNRIIEIELELKKDFPVRPKGYSYYDYMIRIGLYYFTHRDFAYTLLTKKSNFYAFSYHSAIDQLKIALKKSIITKERFNFYLNLRK